MSKTFMDLSFPFVLDLYRTKIKAERRGDASAINSLKEFYPNIFSEDFVVFIGNAKLVAKYLDQKYDQNFSKMFEAEIFEEIDKLLH